MLGEIDNEVEAQNQDKFTKISPTELSQLGSELEADAAKVCWDLDS